VKTLLLVLAIAASACSHSSDARRHLEPEVVLVTRAGEQHVKVEIARHEEEQHRGLMFRDKLEPGRGMIFVYTRPQRLGFWMKNTYIPLDMIFIGGDKHVVYVEENAEPLTLRSRGPNEDSQFVLEVPGGWARAHGVERGVVVRFVEID
jgi:uncharacterized membrane protein (UPF0127 family)